MESTCSRSTQFISVQFMRYEKSSTFVGTTLSEMPTSVTLGLPISHHVRLSLSPAISLSLRILHEWTRTQMLAKPPSNLLQRTRGDHRGGRAQLGWWTFMMTCLRWTLGYTRLEIWRKIGLSGDWRLCTALRTRSGACYYWIGCEQTFRVASRFHVTGLLTAYVSWKPGWENFSRPTVFRWY